MANILPYVNTASSAISAGAGLYSALKSNQEFPPASVPSGKQPINISNPYLKSPILGYSQNLSKVISNPYTYKTPEGEIRGK